jgi:hypothetical protein
VHDPGVAGVKVIEVAVFETMRLVIPTQSESELPVISTICPANSLTFQDSPVSVNEVELAEVASVTVIVFLLALGLSEL